ncbi:GNAT family N-acetyltransferase [Isoptericola jiangsuensis]|uniref:GNAT family N-acetyltransferase n=1 Tax=Isoptericola jiangsuensis TaxID=548579 RepID=UPI003AAC7186
MTTTAAPTWQLVDDPAAFLALAGDTLRADPILATVVTTTAQQWVDRAAAGEPRPDHPCWFAVATDPADAVVGVAMRTAPFEPYPMYVLPMADDVATSLADHLLAHDEHVDAANGSTPAVDVFMRRVAERTGRVAHLDRPTRLYELDTLVPPAPLPAGQARPADRDDLDLVVSWLDVFHPEADRQAGRPDDGTTHPTVHPTVHPQDVLARLDGRRVWLWEVDGRAVSMVGFQGPALGTARVGPVFTPADQRGHGYAGALTAHVARELLDRDARVCLTTDLDNAVSNALYLRLGFRPVGDTAEMVLAPA